MDPGAALEARDALTEALADARAAHAREMSAKEYELARARAERDAAAAERDALQRTAVDVDVSHDSGDVQMRSLPATDPLGRAPPKGRPAVPPPSPRVAAPEPAAADETEADDVGLFARSARERSAFARAACGAAGARRRGAALLAGLAGLVAALAAGALALVIFEAFDREPNASDELLGCDGGGARRARSAARAAAAAAGYANASDWAYAPLPSNASALGRVAWGSCAKQWLPAP